MAGTCTDGAGRLKTSCRSSNRVGSWLSLLLSSPFGDTLFNASEGTNLIFHIFQTRDHDFVEAGYNYCV